MLMDNKHIIVGKCILGNMQRIILELFVLNKNRWNHKTKIKYETVLARLQIIPNKMVLRLNVQTGTVFP